jgi:WD40 repeat protein
MKSDGNEQKLVTLRLGATAPYFASRKSKQNTYYYAVSSDPGRVAVLEKNDEGIARAVSVINVPDGREILNLPLAESEGVRSAKIIPDGTRVLLGAEAARLIDAVSGRTIRTFKGSRSKSGAPAHSWSIAFSQDGARLALSWTNEEANDLEIWDAAALRLLKRVSGEDNQYTSLLFSADGKLLICGSRDAGIYVIDIVSGKVINSFEREFAAGHVNTASLAV